MWSNTQARHANGYRSWAGLSSKNKDKVPTFQQNLKFFFEYQIGWSYIRYFMWNFAGRQNDFMNMDGNSLYGNWESGISFIDNARLGSPSSDVNAPNYLANNKGKNHYFFLPLILGLIGMLFHFKKNDQDALSVLLFFLFTGVLIIVYLNVVPFQPRERDYAYVGSFYAFSIWIGLGVLAIYDFINKNLDSKTSAALATVISLLVPTLMAAENWDDHDRSGRSTALEVAKNNLEGVDNCQFHLASVDDIPLPDESADFGYSLGVLHHIPDTAGGIKACVAKLKKGAPFLIYLYYAFDNKPVWYRFLWNLSEIGRFFISRMPYFLRYFTSIELCKSVSLLVSCKNNCFISFFLKP